MSARPINTAEELSLLEQLQQQQPAGVSNLATRLIDDIITTSLARVAVEKALRQAADAQSYPAHAPAHSADDPSDAADKGTRTPPPSPTDNVEDELLEYGDGKSSGGNESFRSTPTSEQR